MLWTSGDYGTRRIATIRSATPIQVLSMIGSASTSFPVGKAPACTQDRRPRNKRKRKSNLQRRKEGTQGMCNEIVECITIFSFHIQSLSFACLLVHCKGKISTLRCCFLGVAHTGALGCCVSGCFCCTRLAWLLEGT